MRVHGRIRRPHGRGWADLASPVLGREPSLERIPHTACRRQLAIGGIIKDFFGRDGYLAAVGIKRHGIGIGAPMGEKSHGRGDRFGEIPLFPTFRSGVPTSECIPLTRRIRRRGRQIPISQFLGTRGLPIVREIFHIISVRGVLNIQCVRKRRFRRTRQAYIIISRPFKMSGIGSATRNRHSRARDNPLIGVIKDLRWCFCGSLVKGHSDGPTWIVVVNVRRIL